MREYIGGSRDNKTAGSGRSSPFIRSKVRAQTTQAAMGLTSVVLSTLSPDARAETVPLPTMTVEAPAERKKPIVAKPAPAAVARPVVQRPVHRATQPQPLPQVVPSPASSQAGGNGGGGEGGAVAGSAYNPRASQIGRVPTAIVDTPQSITVIPQQLIQDQQTTTLVEALHNVPGISFLGGEGGTQGDNINIRGYSARNDIYRDGIRDPGWYTRDTFSVESVEVLKGPSGFLFGRGSTGGVINLTSKLPKFTNFTAAEVSGYTSPGGRATVDVNRTIGDSAAGRIVLLGNDTNIADRPFDVTRRIGVAPSLTTHIAPDTRATLAYIYQHDNNVPDYGIPLLPGSYFGSPFGQPAPVSKSTFYGTAADRERVTANILTLSVEHDFSKEWQVTNQTRYSNVDRFVSVRGTQSTITSPTNFFTTAAGGTALRTVPLNANLYNLYIANTNAFENHTQNTLATNLTNLNGRFRTGVLEHTISTGIELYRETRDQFRSTYSATADRVDVGAPNPYPAVYGILPLNSTDQFDDGRGAGVYASDQIKLNRFVELLAGVRYDHLTVNQFSAAESTASHAVTGIYSATVPFNVVNQVDYVSWRGGVVLHPIRNSSVYYMHGTSFDPTSEYLTITGGTQSLAPTTNVTDEIGVKYDVFDQKLSLTGALFNTVQSNAIEAINSTLGIYQQVGQTRVKGAEVGVAGKVTQAWSVFGGYTYLDGRVLSSAISQTTGTYVSAPGNKLQDVPRDTITFTSTYAFTPRLTLGGTAYYTTDRYTSSANIGRVPGYWRLDTISNYKLTPGCTLQLNLFNVLNTKNFETLSGFGAAQPGPGRTAVVTAKMKF